METIKPIRSIMLRTLYGKVRKHGTRPSSRFQLRQTSVKYYTREACEVFWEKSQNLCDRVHKIDVEEFTKAIDSTKILLTVVPDYPSSILFVAHDEKIISALICFKKQKHITHNNVETAIY